jgi:5-methylcytosine-specific restriction endonuclease McrA
MFGWGIDETPKRKPIPKGVKTSVWSMYIGADKAEGKCYVCKRTIHITEFDLGHDKAVAKGGKNNISNLRPICRSCNSSMGTMSIEKYKVKYYEPKKVASLKKATVKKASAKISTLKSVKKTAKKTTKKNTRIKKPQNGSFYTLSDLF